ncbi:hypothetical protein [Streptomyces sp. NPDC001833]|uniref:hypothetical protein n=1 Tax=Streptomyces sp. NPDC001833 TaxID=3154658 RepID=UPI003325D476
MSEKGRSLTSDTTSAAGGNGFTTPVVSVSPITLAARIAARTCRVRVTAPATDRNLPVVVFFSVPAQVTFADVLRVRHEADGIPQIEPAWLFDHLMPLGGDPNGPRRAAEHRRHR